MTWAPGLLLLLLLAGFSQLAAAGDIISSSKLESCIANGSQVRLASSSGHSSTETSCECISSRCNNAAVQHTWLQPAASKATALYAGAYPTCPSTAYLRHHVRNKGHTGMPFSPLLCLQFGLAAKQHSLHHKDYPPLCCIVLTPAAYCAGLNVSCSRHPKESMLHTLHAVRS